MKYLLFVVFLSAALFLASCSATPNHPGFYTDYEGMDTVEIVRQFRLLAYSRILVQPIDASAVRVPLNANTRSSVDGIIADATRHVARKLQTKVPRRVAVSVAPANVNPKGNPGALILRSRFVQIDAGSQLARSLIGFGAGKTRVTMEGEFVDGGTGQTLLRFSKSQTRSGGFGPYGIINFNSALLEDNEDEIVDSMGELLDVFNK